MRALVLALAVAACGDNAGCPAGEVCEGQCAVTFSGNFDESLLSAATCPMLTAGELDFAIVSPTLRAELDISIELGTSPSTGQYSPETIGTWSAAVAANAADSECEYSAGSTAVPTGTFSLSLDAVTPLHGTLQILQFVEAAAGTPCGTGETETVEVAF